MIACVITTGKVVSVTVTMAVPVLTFPFTSVTVKVTVLAPILAHEKLVGLTTIVAIPLLSVEPLLIWEAVILAVPDAFNAMVKFCVITVGKILSWTVTVAVPVFTLPLTSVTVKVTVFAPTFADVNVDGFTTIVAILQLSVDPLLTCAAVTLAVPDAFNCTITGCVITVGKMLSCTVTMAVPVLTFPFTSVTVKVTVLAPILAHEKLVGLTTIVAIPLLSVEPLLIWEAVILAVPDAFNAMVKFCVITVGKILSWTVTVAVPVFTLPLTSVTVKVTVFAPTFADVNVDGFTTIVAILQLSVDPLLTCAAVTLAVPDAFNCTITGCVITVGNVVSDRVRTAVLELTQPLEFTACT